MSRRGYEGQTSSVAGALELIGERWTILILRDAFLGVRRFDEFHRSLGVARNVLNDRLRKLCDGGIMERRQYQDRPPRFEYRLTDKGIDLWPMLMQLMRWGDKYVFEGKAPVLVEHRGCGGLADDHLICDKCGERLDARDTTPRAGPGAPGGEPVQPWLK